MKRILLFVTFLCFAANAQTISHSTSMDLGTTNVACNNGTAPNTTSSDNRYYRFFNLSTFGITAPYTVNSVQYGVQAINLPSLPAGFPVTVKLYVTANSNFPTGYPTGYVEVASATTNHTAADVATLVTVPITAVIPTGSNLLVEVSYAAQAANSLNRIFLSANSLGQTAPTYLSSTGCGIVPPTDLAAITFPNAHLVLSVTGTTLGVADNLLGKVSIYPNPAKDIVNIEMPVNVELQKAWVSDITGKQIALPLNQNTVDISRFDSGVYMLTLETSEGNVTRKIIIQ